jgi:GNAT superfamily N-acetyltransferase
MKPERLEVIARNTRAEDFDAIVELSKRVYPQGPYWSSPPLASHLELFPEGQLVAVEKETGRLVGMAASLVVLWDDYDRHDSWRDFTDHGMFTNHDPENGRTLYGAEVMVDPDCQGRGVGKRLYAARRDLCERLNLRRIRAGARLRGYGAWADRLTPEAYVLKVVEGEIGDPTLSFQLSQGFRILGVVSDYLRNDPESLGYAALIEWINVKAARPEEYAGADPRFQRPPR